MIALTKSALSLLAVTSTATALSIHPLPSSSHKSHVGKCISTVLHLEDRNASELEGLQSKRDQLKKMAQKKATKPDDDLEKNRPRFGEDIDNMSKDDLQQYMASIGSEDIQDNIEAMLAGELSFKTKRGPSGAGKSTGRSSKSSEEEDEEEVINFTDYDADGGWDENDLHIPNRIGFTTVDWADSTKGFVNGKLKKADRKMGMFNKADLKKAYNKLEKSGVTFIETSETFGKADSLFSKINKNVELDNGPEVASIFPNPWKQALRNRSRPRAGADGICNAAEQACGRLGVTSMSLYQVENPWFYIGGTKALGQGMLEVIQDGHAQHVGCVDMSVSKLYKLQRFLKGEYEFVATNQFEFSLTNRKNMAMINACKKLGITPICRNVLDGGLASGKYTPTTPTGGLVSKGEGDKGPYSLRKLEKLDALFKAMEFLAEAVSKRVRSDLLSADKGKRPDINTAITTTQIAINYVKAKGAVPLISVRNVREANELLGCLGWELTEEEVDELEKACKTCGL